MTLLALANDTNSYFSSSDDNAKPSSVSFSPRGRAIPKASQASIDVDALVSELLEVSVNPDLPDVFAGTHH